MLAELDTTILTDVGWLNATERMALWLKLQEYARPKLQRVAVASESEPWAAPGVVQIEVVGTVRPPITRQQDVVAETAYAERALATAPTGKLTFRADNTRAGRKSPAPSVLRNAGLLPLGELATTTFRAMTKINRPPGTPAYVAGRKSAALYPYTYP